MEPNTAEATELINKLKKYYKVGTIQELAEKLGVKQNTISGWKQSKPELISTIIQLLIKKGE